MRPKSRKKRCGVRHQGTLVCNNIPFRLQHPERRTMHREAENRFSRIPKITL